jgi:hypothetical protein
LRIATHEGTRPPIPVSASKYASAKGCIQRLSRPQNEAKIINDFKGAGAQRKSRVLRKCAGLIESVKVFTADAPV